MLVHRRRGRYLTGVLPVSLVALLGIGGLWAGQAAGQQAETARRTDRLALQTTLAGLAGQYSQVTGAEMLAIVDVQSRAGSAPWTGQPGSATDARRLRQAAEGARVLGFGAALLIPPGTVTATYTPPGHTLPSPADPGWEPLRATARSGRGTLPVSGVLSAGGTPVMAVAVPVTLATGGRGLLIGMTELQQGPLQKYVSRLAHPDGRSGYVVDSRGLVIAGPTLAEVGQRLRYPHVLGAITRGRQGIRTVREGGVSLVTSYARAGDTDWVALTIQDDNLFLGPLRRAARRTQIALVALLLAAGALLLLLHRVREAVLRDDAVSDHLTGLYNRRGWFAVATHEIERARRARESRGVLFFDIDGLKQINDALGHPAGDRAIVDAARVLRRVSRTSDVLGRLSGDEFVLLLGDASDPEVVRQRVLEALATRNADPDSPFDLVLSVGGDVWRPDDGRELVDVVAQADLEMYADKATHLERSPRG